MAGIRLAIDPTGMDTGAKQSENALERVIAKAGEAEEATDKVGAASKRTGKAAAENAAANDNLAGSLGRVSPKAKGAEASLLSMSGVMRKAAGAAGLLVGSIVSMQTAAAAFSAARGLDAALAETSTLIEGTAAQMAGLEEGARSMSRTFGGTAAQQVKAYYQAISAGATSVEAATSLLDTANRLAVGGVTDVTTAVDILTTATNVYAQEGLSAASASDALFVAMKAGKTTIGELSSSLGKVLPLAQKLGVSFDETAASVAALTKGGIGTAEAVTGLRAAMTAVLGPSAEAQKLAEQIGLKFNAASLEAKGFAGFMADVVAKTGGSTTAMQTLFGSVEATTVALSLSGAAGGFLAEILDDMTGKAGATQSAFEKLNTSLDGRLSRATAALGDIMLSLGQVLLTVGVPALEATAAVAVVLADNMDFLGITMGILALTKIPAMVASLAAMGSGLLAYTGAASAAALATGAVAAAMNLIPLVAVATGLTMLYRGLSDNRSMAEEVATAIGSVTTAQDALNAATMTYYSSVSQANLDAMRLSAENAKAQVMAALDVAKAELEAAKFTSNLFGVSLWETDRMAAAQGQIDMLSGKLMEVESQLSAIDVAADRLAGGFGSANDEATQLAAIVVSLPGSIGGAAGAAEKLAGSLGKAAANAWQTMYNMGQALALEYELATGPGSSLRGMDDERGSQRAAVGSVAQFRGDQARSALAARMSKMNAPASSGSTGSSGGASAANQVAQSYDSLISTLDPLTQASQEFTSAQETINAALKAGYITATDAAKAYGLAQERFESATDAASKGSGVWSQFQQAGGNAIDRMIAGTAKLKDVLKDMVKELVLAIAKQSLLGKVKGGSSSDSIGGLIFKGLFGGFFDTGGFLPAGMDGIVGENGPERIKATSRGVEITSRADTARMDAVARGPLVTSRSSGSTAAMGAGSQQPVQVEVIGGDLTLSDDGTIMARVRVMAVQAAQAGQSGAIETVRASLGGWSQQLQTDGALA